MPLEILAPLVVVGIAGLALLTHLMGWTRRPAFGSADEAAAAFLSDYPETAPTEIALSEDGRSALMLVGGGVGFAERFGDGRVTRLFRRGDLVSVAGAGALKAETRDFGLPAFEIDFPEAAAREIWRARLAALTGEGA